MPEFNFFTFFLAFFASVALAVSIFAVGSRALGMLRYDLDGTRSLKTVVVGEIAVFAGVCLLAKFAQGNPWLELADSLGFFGIIAVELIWYAHNHAFIA